MLPDRIGALLPAGKWECDKFTSVSPVAGCYFKAAVATEPFQKYNTSMNQDL